MFGRGEYKLEESAEVEVPPPAPLTAGALNRAARVTSLDAYRGLIMILLAGGAFGLREVARQHGDDPAWQDLLFHVTHPVWLSQFSWIGVSAWDLIQPAFMFMVGVALPFSVARRKILGQSTAWRGLHCAWRSLLLVGLGVFLASQSATQTVFEFTNVLAQIGLGYGFVYVASGWKTRFHVVSFFAIMAVTWALFYFGEPTRGEDFKEALEGVAEMEHETIRPWVSFTPWMKGSNVAASLDMELLNSLPRAEGKPYVGNGGGYQTLNFLPSIATMLLGLIAGTVLQGGWGKWKKLWILVAMGAVCMLLAIPTGLFLCPIVKRIWTPSWVLFSGAWVIWGLAVFYFLFDLLPLKWLAFPLVIVGMNSLVMYMMGQLIRPWVIRTMSTHLDWIVQATISDSTFGRFGPVYEYATAFVAMWLVCFWMYRRKLFVRV